MALKRMAQLEKTLVIESKLLKILTRKNYRYSSTELHKELGLLMVKDIHDLFVSVFVYKQRNDLLPDIYNDYFLLNSEVQQRTTYRHNDNIYVNRSRTSGGSKSLKIVGAKMWNKLPLDIRNSPSLNCFKKRCRTFIFNLIH